MRNLLPRVQANIGRQLLLNDLVATIETDFEEYGRVVDEAPSWRAEKGERIDFWVLHNSRADLMREMTLWMNAPG